MTSASPTRRTRTGASSNDDGAEHASGTDRIAEVAGQRGWRDDTIVVNVQGDEPRIAPELIREVAGALQQHHQAAMSTACHALHRDVDLFDPNVVKVVLDANGDALYFSRATIPWARDAFAADRTAIPAGLAGVSSHRHLCVSLRLPATTRACRRRQSSASRRSNSCARCGTALQWSVRSPSMRPKPAVDTPDDLDAVRRLFAAGT